MYCNHCGKVIQDDAIHCAYCGCRIGLGPSRRRLLRSRSEHWFAGVCGGLAEYFDLDVVLVRIVWLIVTVFGGGGLIAYLVCWIVIPKEPAPLYYAPPMTQQVSPPR